jgi:hypothetical protein
MAYRFPLQGDWRKNQSSDSHQDEYYRRLDIPGGRSYYVRVTVTHSFTHDNFRQGGSEQESMDVTFQNPDPEQKNKGWRTHPQKDYVPFAGKEQLDSSSRQFLEDSMINEQIRSTAWEFNRQVGF